MQTYQESLNATGMQDVPLTFDSAMPLTVLVRRIVGEGREEIGTGLLISRNLVLTALHVVCDFGPGQVVPEHDLINIRLQFDIAEKPPDGDSKIVGRLIWPPPGAPASSDKLDTALIALDNDGLASSSKQVIMIESILEVDAVIERYYLEAFLGKLRFARPRAGSLDVTFCGYTSVAQRLLERSKRNAGLSEAMAIPTPGMLRDPQVVKTGHYLMDVDKLFERTDGQPNPLGGGSGAAVWHYADETDRLEICGTLQRAPPTEVAKDCLLITPFPASDEFKALVPAQLFEGSTKASLSEITVYPVAKARQVMHRLDRAEPVRSYLDAFQLTKPKGYLFAFVSTQWDGSTAFLRRLQEESARAENPFFDRILCPKPGVSVVPISGMTSPVDLQRIFARLADAVLAARPDSPTREPTIKTRISSGAVSRLLMFDVEDTRLFDRMTCEARDGFKDTLRSFLQEVADWSKPSVTPPSGETLERDNPLIAVLNVVANGPDFNDARDRAQKVIGKLSDIFAESGMVPSDLYCQVYPFLLDEIAFTDFETWCRDEVQMQEFADAVGRVMNPPFDGGTRNFNLISLGLDAIIDRKWGK
ncbi:hypothetical protein EHI42_19665 [Rhizobium hidalgonense]|uniref:hypothetical protein n=1 Tax=Rhizobium hidalgonense TaxID=1538159 RepID=UPI000FEC2246|nr:hypothetical protein [Rhizobium hidalgonense]RWX13615.1 hypothetical protein EHI42_19665 [Rhizobium hidalgonense]